LAITRACADKTRPPYESKARDLYDLLLAPAQKHLAGKKRLNRLPGRSSVGLPFHALMSDDPNTGIRQFVAEQYELTYAYSATGVDAAWRKKRTHSAPNRPAPARLC
jgi:hypothetical protein